jgi:predicted dehydrogenase
MKFAIVGCGSIGQRHIRTLLSLGHNVIAYNRNAERRAEVREKFGIQVYDNLEKLLSASADAAIICSPNSMHIQHAVQSARAGLHLFIEKPLSHNLDGIETLRKEVRERNLLVHVGSNMRFHLGPAKIKSELENGTVGQPLWAFLWGGMYLPDWHPDEDYRLMYSSQKQLGGGVVLDFIHEQDLIIWLFGIPDIIAAMTNRSGWLEIETEDTADAILKYSNGLQVNLHMDYLQKPDQRGIRIIGTKGSIEWDHIKQHVEISDIESGIIKKYPHPNGYCKQDMYLTQMKYFIECLTFRKHSTSGLESAACALQLALDIKRSSDSHVFVKRTDYSFEKSELQ